METLARLCVNRPVFATMLIVSLVVAGAFSYTTLGVDLFPQVDLPTVAVTVTNPGASPTEIETEITDKIEEAVNTISGIDELRSTSVEGSSQVIITFILEKNGDTAAQEVRDKVNLAIGQLPETANEPTYSKIRCRCVAGFENRRFRAETFAGSYKHRRQANQTAHRKY